MKSFKKTMLIAGILASFSVHAAPIFNVFELGVQQGKEEKYNSIGENNINKSVGEEKGTLAMYSVRQKENPNMTYMFEVYRDDASYKIHAQSPQYREFLEASSEILTDHKKKFDIVPQFLGDKKFTQDENTVARFVTVEVKSGNNARFRKIVIDEMKKSLKAEKGVVAMYAATDKNHPEKWYFFEIYRSQEDYLKHRETPHFKKYLRETEKITGEKTFIEVTPEKLMNKGNLNFNILDKK